MLDPFYRLLWHSLQMIIAFYQLLHWLYLRWQAVLIQSYDFYYRHTVAHRDRVYLEQCKEELNKIPRHLNIIVGPQETGADTDLLVRIINYALSMDINFISFYDTRLYGQISMDRVTVPQGLHCKQLDEYHWSIERKKLKSYKPTTIINGGTKLLSNGEAVNGTMLNGDANGNNNHSDIEEHKSIEILEIKAHHGCPLIAAVCRSLYNRRDTVDMQNTLKVRKELEECIDKELSSNLYNIPDPELSIIFNTSMCTFGMLPWQTRFTEFHKIESGSHFDSKAFAKILYKYSRCEQRFGK